MLVIFSNLCSDIDCVVSDHGFFCLTIFFSFQVVLFQFGLGANAHYVILELYAQGNILLTDSEFMVMTLLRSHRLAVHLSCCICFCSFMHIFVYKCNYFF